MTEWPNDKNWSAHDNDSEISTTKKSQQQNVQQELLK